MPSERVEAASIALLKQGALISIHLSYKNSSAISFAFTAMNMENNCFAVVSFITTHQWNLLERAKLTGDYQREDYVISCYQ